MIADEDDLVVVVDYETGDVLYSFEDQFSVSAIWPLDTNQSLAVVDDNRVYMHSHRGKWDNIGLLHGQTEDAKYSCRFTDSKLIFFNDKGVWLYDYGA